MRMMPLSLIWVCSSALPTPFALADTTFFTLSELLLMVMKAAPTPLGVTRAMASPNVISVANAGPTKDMIRPMLRAKDVFFMFSPTYVWGNGLPWRIPGNFLGIVLIWFEHGELWQKCAEK